jgi:four helix bundle protein
LGIKELSEGGVVVNADELKQRTKAFALRVMKCVASMPNRPVAWVIGKQLLRCGTSVGANYRAACRARSKAEFVAKLAIVIEEADECCYWLELVIESGLIETHLVTPLLAEANELTAIMVASRKTATS